MSRLRQRIRDCILQDGPMPVSLYMAMCLHDSVDGYYATRPGLGRDFVTAPEVSQVFGELLGAWAAHEWAAMGSPKAFQLVEIGPGRGAMMVDMLRAANKAPGFKDAARIVMIEASPKLRAKQAQQLKGARFTHINTLSELGAELILMVANEFLDCLPIRQFVKMGDSWHERCVGLSEDGATFRFGLGGPASALSGVAGDATEAEVASGVETLLAELSDILRTRGGRALFIDYGLANATPSDTLRAYRDGAQINPLSTPGECDLTADVDFARVALAATKSGLVVHGPVSQQAFLHRLGASDRFQRLAAKNPTRRDELERAYHRLTDPREMGERFQAICLSSSLPTAPAGFDAPPDQTSTDAG